MFGENGMKRTASALGFCLLFTLQAITLSAQSTDKGLYETDEEYADRMAAQSASVSEKDAVMHSSSYITWTKGTFTSEINLNVQKAGIPLPSGKSAAINRIQMDLPVLIKDPLLSLYVDDTQTIGDLVLQGTLTLEEITRIISAGKQTPAYFAANGTDLQTKHLLSCRDIGSPLVKHHTPYSINTPIEHIASRAYTGIIIDARGTLPIQGEFTSSVVSPCLFPRIYNENMDLLYERNMVDPTIAKQTNIVYYGSDDRKETYIDRVGKDPLWITAKKVYGVNRCDPVISHDDYLKIATIPSNVTLLTQGHIVLLPDQAQLEHAVTAPEKNKRYYLDYKKIRDYIIDNKVPDVVVLETGPEIGRASCRERV